MEISRILVYGTLLSGMSNHERFCGDALTIEPAFTTGRLYHLPYGFPAMFDVAGERVYGEIMTFPDIAEKLKQLDYLEGFRPNGGSHYIRIKKTAVILAGARRVAAWTYVYHENRLREVERSGILVPGGRWKEFMKE